MVCATSLPVFLWDYVNPSEWKGAKVVHIYDTESWLVQAGLTPVRIKAIAQPMYMYFQLYRKEHISEEFVS